MLIDPETLWLAVLTVFVLSAAALVLAIVSRHVKSEGLWLAAVALGTAAAPLLPYVLAALYVKEGLPYGDALAAGAYTAPLPFIFFVAGVAGASLSSSR